MKQCVVTPVAKPRMVQSDKWKNRPAVMRYWAFKDEINLWAKMEHFVLSEKLNIICYLPMPESWSKKKKEMMLGKPHQQKPDWDNLGKAICDALAPDDAYIWDARVRKYWSLIGSIEFLEEDEIKKDVGEILRSRD